MISSFTQPGTGVKKNLLGEGSFVLFQFSLIGLIMFEIIEDIMPYIISYFIPQYLLLLLVGISGAVALISISENSFFNYHTQKRFYRILLALSFFVIAAKLRHTGVAIGIFFTCMALIFSIFVYRFITTDKHVAT